MTFPTETGRRGRAFGERWRAETRAVYGGYAELFALLGADDARVRAWGERAIERTAAWAPALAREMDAIAAGAGMPAWQIGALNARTEILAALRAAGEGECSTAISLPGGGLPPRTVQTWDWHDHMRGGGLLWSYEPRPGHRVRTFTEFGVLAKIGVGSAGLGVHFNILKHATDGAGIGVPVHLVARRILDEAATLDEAVRIARGARVSASTAIGVVTYDGRRADARVLELSPAGLGVVEPGAGGFLPHTNHFVDPALVPGERHGTGRPGTYGRYDLLRKRAGGLRDPDPTRRAHAMLGHGPDGPPVCAHADPALPLGERWESLATISLDLDAGRLRVHRGGPCAVTAPTWQIF